MHRERQIDTEVQDSLFFGSSLSCQTSAMCCLTAAEKRDLHRMENFYSKDEKSKKKRMFGFDISSYTGFISFGNLSGGAWTSLY